MIVVDDGSAAHWTADHLSSFRGHRGKSLAAIVCSPKLALKWNPMTMEFALTQALLKPGGGVHLRPWNKTTNNGVSISREHSILASLQVLAYDFHRAPSTKPATTATAKVAIG